MVRLGCVGLEWVGSVEGCWNGNGITIRPGFKPFRDATEHCAICVVGFHRRTPTPTLTAYRRDIQVSSSGQAGSAEQRLDSDSIKVSVA